MKQALRTAAVIVTIVSAGMVSLAGGAPPQPPKGFTPLFNGKDLTGWRGRQPNYNPAEEAKLPQAELAAKQAEWNTARDLHWKVDTAKGEIVSDGQSPHLATAKDYGDFEFHVDWLMVSHNGDSGVYLRGYPQVQVWDPDNPREVKNGAAKGSGALWNDNPENPGKWPLVKADNPVGEWNSFRITDGGLPGVGMVERQGDSRRAGARQLLRPHPAPGCPRSDRAPDTRVGDPLQEHLRARDSRERSQGDGDPGGR